VIGRPRRLSSRPSRAANRGNPLIYDFLSDEMKVSASHHSWILCPPLRTKQTYFGAPFLLVPPPPDGSQKSEIRFFCFHPLCSPQLKLKTLIEPPQRRVRNGLPSRLTANPFQTPITVPATPSGSPRQQLYPGHFIRAWRFLHEAVYRTEWRSLHHLRLPTPVFLCSSLPPGPFFSYNGKKHAPFSPFLTPASMFRFAYCFFYCLNFDGPFPATLSYSPFSSFSRSRTFLDLSLFLPFFVFYLPFLFLPLLLERCFCCGFVFWVVLSLVEASLSFLFPPPSVPERTFPSCLVRVSLSVFQHSIVDEPPKYRFTQCLCV